MLKNRRNIRIEGKEILQTINDSLENVVIKYHYSMIHGFIQQVKTLNMN